jgi:hypothetical protein
MRKKKKTATEPTPLIPPDPHQCQAEKPNGHSFMTLGGVPGLVRYTNVPSVIAAEVEADEYGRHGSMSLCGDCLNTLSSRAELRLLYDAFQAIRTAYILLECAPSKADCDAGD